MYLILQFYSEGENCENLMLAKYTCFTVCFLLRATHQVGFRTVTEHMLSTHYASYCISCYICI